MEINPNEDITGNAPLIPRKVLIEVLNELQLLQTKVLIALNQYEPAHLKGTEARPDQVTPIVWTQSSSGTGSEQVVPTTT